MRAWRHGDTITAVLPDLSSYLEPFAFSRLNAVEKILMARARSDPYKRLHSVLNKLNFDFTC